MAAERQLSDTAQLSVSVLSSPDRVDGLKVQESVLIISFLLFIGHQMSDWRVPGLTIARPQSGGHHNHNTIQSSRFIFLLSHINYIFIGLL